MSSRALEVTRILIRLYRPIALWTLSILVVGIAIGMAVIDRFTDPPFSLWVMIVGQAAKYWLLVVGIILVSMYLRQFVAGGVTRRDFLAGSGIFGVGFAVMWSLLVPIGHAVESALLSLSGTPAGYPRITLPLAAGEFGHVLPSALAFLVSGMAITAGFYRFGGWPGILLLIPGALPMAASEGLLGLGERGETINRWLPNLPAVGVILLVSLALALAGRHLLRDVAIRTAGAG